MKSKIILISIFLLAICMIGPIAASDNVTDEPLQDAEEITVSYNHTVYKDDLGSIDVELPEGTSGNLRATINYEEFYNENVSSSVKIPISIPKKAIPWIVVNRNTDHVTYFIDVYFNGTLIKNDTLKVMNVPSNFTTQGFPSEILRNDPYGYVILWFPESANGNVSIYIDGKLSFNQTAQQYMLLDVKKFNSLALGNHNVTIVYSGDSYYKRFNKTFNFTVVDVLIDIPTNIVFDHDDCISGRTVKYTDGVVTILVDNKAVFKSKLDEYGEFLHSMFNDLTCGEHQIEVQFKAKNFKYSKKANVTASYYVDMFTWGEFIYGEEGTVVIIVPPDFNKKLINITIDGVQVKDFEIDNSGWIEIDVSRCIAGNHTVKFDFPGDKKYTNYTISDNFTVDYKIVLPTFVDFGSEKTVYLCLPDSASGLLEVYINGEFYKSDKITKGYASVDIEELIPGLYNISARYTGDDFNVSEESGLMELQPSFKTPGEMYCGEDKSMVVMTSKDVKGKIIFSIADKEITVQIKNGKAVLPLKNFKADYYDIFMEYVGDNGYNTTLYGAVDILPATIDLVTVKITSQSAKMKVYINGKLAKNTYVTFKVDGKTKKVKTDKYGVATITLTPGTHKITATYKDAKTTKTVRAPVVFLNSVSVRKSAKKVVLTAVLKKDNKLLKNKVVTFKFNGKTLKVKTNSKGIAKATFKTSGLKVASKVTYSAAYSTDIVKKTAIVKK